MEGITVLIIMTMCYGFVEILKTSLKNERFLTLIPAITAVFGALIGILIYFLVPQLVPDANFIESLIVGVCSGLSSTGTHQVSKQLEKYKEYKQLFNGFNETEIKTDQPNSTDDKEK